MIVYFSGDLVCENVLHLRKKYYMSRRTLARLIGISPYRLRDLEEGLISPPAVEYESLVRLTQVFNVSLKDLANTDMREPKQKT